MPHKCPEAERQWRRGYTKQRRERLGDRLREQERGRAETVLAFVRSYKLALGCTDCGYSAHHAALEFDHIAGDKALNVCNAKSIAQAKAEIAKCEVVCSNCHRIRTFERLQEDKAQRHEFAKEATA